MKIECYSEPQKLHKEHDKSMLRAIIQRVFDNQQPFQELIEGEFQESNKFVMFFITPWRDLTLDAADL